MRETQMLFALGFKPKPSPKGLAAPPIHERDCLRVYDRELGGTVPVLNPQGQQMRDTRRSAFSIKLKEPK